MDENVSNEKPIRNRKGLSIFFNIFITFLSIIALAVAGVLIYQKRYLSPFWVNGQSMYPTLNKFALDPNGVLYKENGPITLAGSKNVDYGVMDKHERALKSIKRFDVVVCKYSADDPSDKIKRVVGLPNETIKFGQGDDNGKLYVKNGDDFVLVEQPIANEYIVAGDYKANEIILGSDEYFVLGDNRGHSSDSRNNGPIKYDWLVGKVVCVCAHCEVRNASDGGFEPFNINHFLPRFL